MRTGKAISNISYQSPAYFGTMCNALRQSGAIGPVLWIAHKGEGGDKDHIHFVLLGGFKTYKTEGLSSLWSVEQVNGKPASVTALWRTTSDVSDWLLYGIHDPEYLAHKASPPKEHAYTWADVHCTTGDEDILQQLQAEARERLDSMGDKTVRRLIAMCKAGYSFDEVLLRGLIPTAQFTQAAKIWPYVLRKFGKDQQPNEEWRNVVR